MRNLLWITADQWRHDAIGAHGDGTYRTPCIDRLARWGVSFQAHYIQAAPCGPSRVSMHTGHYPHVHGSWTNGSPAKPGLDNWALALRAHGWDVGLVGYTHYPDPARGFEGLLAGVEPIVDFRIDQRAWRDWISKIAPGWPQPADLLAPLPGTGGQAGAYRWGAASYPYALSDTRFLASAAVDFLRARRSRPWALHVTFFRPHDPYVATEDCLAATPLTPLRRTGHGSLDLAAAQHPYLALQRTTARALPPEDSGDLAQVRRHYAASVAEMDAGVGEILEAVDQLSLWDDTLVIVTSDHGDQLGDHWLMGKLGVFDQSFRTPLIIRADAVQGGRRGQVHTGVTEAIDLVPTLLDLLCAETPSNLPGRSLRAAIEGSPGDDARVARWGYDYSDTSPRRATPRRLTAWRSRDLLYAAFSDLPPLLIDYRRDGESAWINRAGDLAYGEAIDDLLARSGGRPA
jgi:arylsulfatase A-like enzyme